MRLQLLISPRSLQSVAGHFKSPSFRSGGDAGVNGISAKIETYRVKKVKICLIKYEEYDEIFSCRPTLALPSCTAENNMSERYRCDAEVCRSFHD